MFTPDAGRVRVAIVLPGIDRPVDVTAHPAAATAMLRQTALDAGQPPDAHEADARAVLADAVAEAGAWLAPTDASLLTALGGAGFPVLASAYERGAAPLDEVPRWAVPVLAAATAREAAVATLDDRATRPVVAAFASSLVHPDGGEVQLWRLAIARMAHQALQPDQLARVLLAPGPARSHEVIPNREHIDVGRSLLVRWGAHRTTNVLVDACAETEGPRLLAEAVRFGTDLGVHAPGRLPNRLRELHTVYRSRIATDATPPPPPPQPVRVRPAAPPRAEPAAPRPRADAVLGRALVPPRPARGRGPAPAAPAPAPPSSHTPIASTGPVRLLDGFQVGTLRIVVPRTCGDLQRWSRLLGNCLDTYGRAAAAGESTILGVERDGGLRYALEVDRRRVIRQFLGSSNRPADPDDRAAVIRVLADQQIVDVRHPDNRAWLGAAGLLAPTA